MDDDFAPPNLKFPLIQHGVPFICRMCNHLMNATLKGMSDCGQPDCGGPLTKGLAFPWYMGPLSNVLLNYCFYCGNPSEVLIQVDDGRKLGFCRNCEQKLIVEEVIDDKN